jgi:hypothetical protein
MTHTTNPYPVDSDNVTRGAGIPADDLDRLIAATIPDWRTVEGLTDEQTARLTAGTHMKPDELLDIARDYAAQNQLQAALADIPAPPGAISAGAWWQWHDEAATRTVYGNRWEVGNAVIVVMGEQSADGAARWQIEVQAVDGTNGDITAAQARELAAALVQAAQELDRLTGDAPPFM